MGVSKIIRAASLIAIGMAFTAADTVAPMITDAVSETDSLNNVDAATLPRHTEPIEEAMPTPVNGQITDSSSGPSNVNGRITDATTDTRRTPGVYASDAQTTVNPQVTDAVVTNVQTPGVYINEVDAQSDVGLVAHSGRVDRGEMGMGSEGGYRSAENESHSHSGSKY